MLTEYDGPPSYVGMNSVPHSYGRLHDGRLGGTWRINTPTYADVRLGRRGWVRRRPDPISHRPAPA